MRVPGIGPKDCSIAFIGEAPGSTEAKLGKPFIGPAGQLLDKLLMQSGISRSQVYLTNVVKEQPFNNDISHFITIKPNGVTRTDAFIRYVNELKAELDEVKANVLVAVGNIPLYTLTSKLGIMKWRGSILESTLLPGRKVIPIIHPAAALRQYILQHYISFDLKRVMDESVSPDVKKLERKLLFQPSLTDVSYHLAMLLTRKRPTAFDIEVLNEEVSCISIGDEESIMSIPFIREGKDYFTENEEADVWLMISDLLEDEDIVKVGQNINFDMTFLYRKYGIKTKNIADTMVGMGILYPDFPKGLDFITSIYTKEPYYKDDGKKWFKFGGSFKDLWLYNAKDSAVTLEAYPKILSDLGRLGNLQAYERKMKIIEPLVFMQEHGMRIDVEGLKKASEDAATDIEKYTSQLKEVTKMDFNHRSTKQLADYFYRHLKIRPYLNRKTGNETVDINALKRIARKGYEAATIILKIRAIDKFKSTYADMVLDRDGRLRTSFNPVGTVSGRLSSSKTIFGTGGNVQNLPEAFRKYILADEGYVVYNMDLGQAENRIVAYVAPEPTMIEAFETGKDVHSLTASLISGIPANEIKQMDDEQIFCEIGGGIYTWRFWGKKANHGLNYDLGYKTFAFYYEIPESDSKFIVEKYHNAYPGVRQYHSWIRAQLSKDRTLVDLLGKRRRFMDRWGDDLFKEAYSYMPQSTVSSKIDRDGICAVYYHPSKRAVLLNQVHDSIIFQIPLTYTWEQHASFLMDVKKEMESELEWRGRTFQIPADISMGFNLSKKEMEKVKANDYSTIPGLARHLDEVYGRIRSTKELPLVGRDWDDISSLTEESSFELGDATFLP
ncbi:uracil-DNA glycosylase [Azospirillaceae bacterium]